MDSVTITFDRAQVADWRITKATASRDSGKSFTWGDFFDMLVASYEWPPEPLVAHMAQDPPSVEDAPDVTLIPNDALTLEVAEMMGGRAASLTDATCELIAEKVAEKIMERLKAFDQGLSED